MLRTAVLALLVAGCATFSPVDRALLDQLEPELGQLLLVGFDGTEGAESPGLRTLVCDTRVGGVFEESIVGLHRNPIFVSGRFELRRVSAVPVLNQ